jgi:capsular polysaccharide biosynthesis protein
MSMFEITALLWRRRLVVGAVSVGLAVIGALVVLLGGSTSYTAESQVLIDQPQLIGNAGASAIPNKLAALTPTLCRLLDGDRAVAAIAQTSGRSVPEARDDVRCRPIEGTTIMQVLATADTAGVAQELSSKGAQVLADAVDARYAADAVPERERLDAEVLLSARRPSRSSGHTVRSLALVAVGALLAAAAFAVAAEPHRSDADPAGD